MPAWMGFFVFFKDCEPLEMVLLLQGYTGNSVILQQSNPAQHRSIEHQTASSGCFA